MNGNQINDRFCYSTLVSTAFSFCQASEEQIAINMVHALNDKLNTELFPELGKLL